MFRWPLLVLLLVLTLMTARVSAQPARFDMLADNFFSPELLISHAQEIGLTDEQKQLIEVQYRENRRRFFDLQQQLQQQTTALSEVLHREHPAEQEAMAALDQVLGTEREIKHLQLKLSLVIRGQLTAEQVAKAKELRPKYLAEPRARLMESVRGKMQQLQERIRQTQAQGGDVAASVRAVAECRRLIQEGKPAEAEAALDRALAAIAPSAAPGSTSGTNQGAGTSGDGNK